MDSKTRNQLAEAKIHFYAGRIVDAYNLLRRFFDRLPFAVEPEHSDYIGIFVRVLAELGKLRELNFYAKEIEKQFERSRKPHIAYALAYVYWRVEQQQAGAACELLEEIARDTSAADSLRNNAKMLLAKIYEEVYGDIAASQQVIASLADPSAEPQASTVAIWRAKLLLDRGKLEEAEQALLKLLASEELGQNWYLDLAARVIYATLLVRRGDVEGAEAVHRTLNERFTGFSLRSAQQQLDALDREIQKVARLARLSILRGEGELKLLHRGKFVSLRRDSVGEKLLLLLRERGIVGKEAIAQHLYSRPYEPTSDDQLVYYHIRTLRKRLESIGILDALTTERDGYRLLVEFEDEPPQTSSEQLLTPTTAEHS